MTTEDPAGDLQLDPDLRMPYTDRVSIGLDREVGARLIIFAAYIGKVGRAMVGEASPAVHRKTVSCATIGSASIQVDQPSEQASVPSDESRRIPADVRRPAHRRRETPARLAGVRLLHAVEGVRAAAVERDDRRRRAGRDRRIAARRVLLRLSRSGDPNNLTNALGRLPNDRPHMFRVMASVDVPRTSVVVAANLQHLSGKPWAATVRRVNPQDPDRRIPGSSLVARVGFRPRPCSTFVVSESVPAQCLGRE